MEVNSGFMDLIGNTPMMELSNIIESYRLNVRLLAKLEYFNPAGSIKDRIAKMMVEEAEAEGLLKPGFVIIEPTSGNTGIGLAAVAAARGYRIILTMPDTMSAERRGLLKAYGAEIILTDGSLGMQGAIDKAQELAGAIPDSFLPGQFDNPSNPAAHEIFTGPEIWKQTDGQVDIFVAGIGTGGTISGVGEFLRFQKPEIEVIGVEPAASPMLTENRSGSHNIQGIGAGFIPKVLNTAVFSEIIKVTEEDAYAVGRDIARHEGILVGISSGAAAWAAIQAARRPENSGKNIVVIFPDSGERYLSTPMFNDL